MASLKHALDGKEDEVSERNDYEKYTILEIVLHMG